MAAARHPENIIKLDGVTSDKLDLHADVEDITKQVKVFDAIYFTAGSRGKNLIQTDAMELDAGPTNSNPIPDVAKKLAEILKYPNTIDKVIPMSSGNTPIDQALKEI